MALAYLETLQTDRPCSPIFGRRSTHSVAYNNLLERSIVKHSDSEALGVNDSVTWGLLPGCDIPTRRGGLLALSILSFIPDLYTMGDRLR